MVEYYLLILVILWNKNYDILIKRRRFCSSIESTDNQNLEDKKDRKSMN